MATDKYNLTGELGEPINLLFRLEALCDAAQLVLDRWESGDLADAVQSLATDLHFAKIGLKAAKSNTDQDTVIEISGGIANLKTGGPVTVRDYDIDGNDNDLTVGEDGQKYHEYEA